MTRTIPLLVLFLALFSSRAEADVWDSKGWVMLGERTVGGNVDRDRIDVGRHEGQFSKLNVVVLESDLELLDFNINFGDRTTYAPKLAHYFKEGQRTRSFDLPPSAKVITHIDIKYRNLPGGGRAKVQVWGWKTGSNAPVPRPATVTMPQWDQKGWQMLGERVVDGRVDNDRIDVGRYEGKFTKLQVVVLDSDLELIDFGVKFGKGPEWRPSMRHFFREGSRTHAIDFPGDERTIKHIEFKYRNLPGGGRAKLQVWGYQRAGDAPTQPGRVWDSQGWTMLGESTVQGGRRGDRDKIIVGRNEGKFRKLQVVVLDSDLELIEVLVKFGRGQPFRPEIKQFFREGQRTKAIDLPGDDRVIKWVEFRYRNLPGGGRAKVQVWAK